MIRSILFLWAGVLLSICSCATAATDWKPGEGKMLTDWGQKVEARQVWEEYPRPQLVRKNWNNLNGLWSYGILDQAEDEVTLKRMEAVEYDATVRSQLLKKILVPFCPESGLSGVGRLLEPDETLWYRRELPVKAVSGERALLHFEAVDHEATVWVNGQEMGKHTGGFTPFGFDITAALKDGGNELVVRVKDATEGWQVRGKQSLKPRGISYTRVSGIWQTVWLEQVPECGVEDLDCRMAVIVVVAGSCIQPRTRCG